MSVCTPIERALLFESFPRSLYSAFSADSAVKLLSLCPFVSFVVKLPLW